MHLGRNRRLGAPDERSAINHNLCEDISLRYAKTNQALKTCTISRSSQDEKNKNRSDRRESDLSPKDHCF